MKTKPTLVKHIRVSGQSRNSRRDKYGNARLAQVRKDENNGHGTEGANVGSMRTMKATHTKHSFQWNHDDVDYIVEFNYYPVSLGGRDEPDTADEVEITDITYVSRDEVLSPAAFLGLETYAQSAAWEYLKTLTANE